MHYEFSYSVEFESEKSAYSFFHKLFAFTESNSCVLYTDCIRQAVDRSEPSKKMGLYWGYNVRYSSNISCVFKECPYQVLNIFYGFVGGA
jgi:hypothetical protein